MRSMAHQDPVEALSGGGTNESLGERVRPRGPNRRADDPDALGSEHLVDGRGERGVPIPDQELRRESCSARTKRRVRARPVTQSPTGLAVTPVTNTLQVSSSMKKATWSSRSSTVSTWKESSMRSSSSPAHAGTLTSLDRSVSMMARRADPDSAGSLTRSKVREPHPSLPTVRPRGKSGWTAWMVLSAPRATKLPDDTHQSEVAPLSHGPAPVTGCRYRPMALRNSQSLDGHGHPSHNDIRSVTQHGGECQIDLVVEQFVPNSVRDHHRDENHHLAVFVLTKLVNQPHDGPRSMQSPCGQPADRLPGSIAARLAPRQSRVRPPVLRRTRPSRP
jgi:hypothetical protein